MFHPTTISKHIFNNYLKLYCSFRKVKTNLKEITFLGHARLKFDKNCHISIGNNFLCRSGIYSIDNTNYSKIIVKKNASLIIGNNSGISNTIIYCSKSIRIGDYVKIGAGCMIFDTNFHSTNWEKRMNHDTDINDAKQSETIIGNHCFIGTNCIIGKGITIGARSIIAAGSVVVKNVPPDELWGGNPAKFIKKLN